MKRILLPFPAQQELTETIASPLGAKTGRLNWRHFPDGESLISIEEQLAGTDVAIVVSLRNPDALALPLLFVARTAREFGANSVGLIAPYLAYMRQDKRFNPGEAISAPLFGRFLESNVDWLVTADPHLHRNPQLARLYDIPVRKVATAPIVADWIRNNVDRPVLIGPDSESEQWVSDIARRTGAPFQILRKDRKGDRDVDVSLPEAASAIERTPVVVDDIVSSGHTFIETVKHLAKLGLPPAVCVVIHPVFAGESYEQLLSAGAARIVSTDSIAHPSNAIPIGHLLAAAATGLFPPHAEVEKS